MAARRLFLAGPLGGRVVSKRVESNVYLDRVEVVRESVLMLKATYALLAGH
jgi:hypothetical protein